MKNIDKKWIDIFNLCMSKEFKNKLHLCNDGTFDYGDKYITPDGKYTLFYYKYNGICDSFRIYNDKFNDGDGWIEFEIEYSGNIMVTYYCNIYDEEGEFCCEIDGKTHKEIEENCNIENWMLKALLELFNY